MARNEPSTNGVLEEIRTLLEKNEVAESCRRLRAEKNRSPALQNALGVCLLRLGEVEKAIDLYRGLVIAGDTVVMRSDAPTVFKTNFATALLLMGNVAGCVATLDEIKGPEHPAVARLRRTIARWKQNHGLLCRFLLIIGGLPSNVRVSVDFPPGDLE